MLRLATVITILVLGISSLLGQTYESGSLQLEVFVSDSNSFCVTSTLIMGTREAILFDVQYHKSEAVKLAERVLASGKRLKAIIISHPDPDHYQCAAIWKERFPNTPIYMTAKALSIFKRNAMTYFTRNRTYYPAETPDSLPAPEVLPTTHWQLDGESIEVVTDLQGDVWSRSNSYLWIPSMRAIVAGDLVFNGVHVWLANSTQKSRAAWLKSLDQLEMHSPRIVIAGHKRDDTTSDSPGTIAATREYIKAFDDEMDNATGSDDLVAIMKHRFKSLALPNILRYAAQEVIPD